MRWPEAITLAALAAAFAASSPSSSSIRAFLLEGSATSYAQFGKWVPGAEEGDWDDQGTGDLQGTGDSHRGLGYAGEGGAAAVSMSLEFRTRHADGLLLYTDDGGYRDFVELKGRLSALTFSSGNFTDGSKIVICCECRWPGSNSSLFCFTVHT